MSTNRNVKIIYTKASGRPPMFTTEMNIANQEQLLGNIIQDIIVLDNKPTVEGQPAVVEKIKPVDRTPGGISDAQLVKELKKRGKTPKVIASFLKMEISLVENLLLAKNVEIPLNI